MKKLFGEKITPNCVYCQNFLPDCQPCCALNRTINQKGKCRKFDYNPTMRQPMAEANMMQFSKEDFEI
ncbi:MAG: hypothetical protein VZR54_04080 [Ruminococcus sp.]|jgi:hypothetical protein|nr:hypothetical protein [Ruminococcus sp.]